MQLNYLHIYNGLLIFHVHETKNKSNMGLNNLTNLEVCTSKPRGNTCFGGTWGKERNLR